MARFKAERLVFQDGLSTRTLIQDASGNVRSIKDGVERNLDDDELLRAREMIRRARARKRAKEGRHAMKEAMESIGMVRGTDSMGRRI